MNIIYWCALLCSILAVAAQNCPSVPCATGTCCSVHGYCGTTDDYCAPANCAASCGCQAGGGLSCSAGQCCSQYGYCGTTADYCSPSNNCFSGCWSSPSGPTPAPTSAPSSSYVFAGYIASWIAQRPASCALSLSSFDPTKYTHLIIPFAGFDTTNFVLSAMNGDDTSGWYTSVVGLKSRNANLKVMISVGGGSFGTGAFSTMASSATNRNKFIANAISFAHNHNFDGIDIDWETPEEEDTANIQALFSAFRTAINSDASSRGKPALLLTATSPNYESAIKAFGFANIYSYLDWIGVMNYDYYGPSWSEVLGSDTGFNSVQATFGYFPGVPKNKFLLGFANYARGFTLLSASQHTPGSPFKGPGQPGPCSRDPDGTLTYNEVAEILSASPAPTVAFDSAAQTPYLYYNSTQWVSYDNTASLLVKLNYLKSSGMKGAMVWTVDLNHANTDYIAATLST